MSKTVQKAGALRGVSGVALALALALGGAAITPQAAQAQIAKTQAAKAQAAQAQAAQAQAAPQASDGPFSEVVVATGKSRVIDLPERFVDVMVADPKIADILPLNTHSIYVVGKAPGSTALTIYGPGKRMLAAVSVVVAGDIEGLKRRVHDILPEERDVQVRAANDSLVLSGTVSNPVALNQILTLAETYSPKRVVNMMTVEGTQQIMLTVRFVEMNRTTSKALRVNTNGLGDLIDHGAGQPSFVFNTGDSIITSAGRSGLDSFGIIKGAFHFGEGDVSVLFDALEDKGLVKTLAEPTLVAMSGDTANFLAGGEFPIPVAQSSSSGAGAVAPTITVEFKQFGVALSFTPTLLKDGLINLVVNPEVSQIDRANSITEGNLVIPGLRVRRAHTTVELRDGESFTIAGMMAEDYANNIRQLPFIGDIPILGDLFRSSSFQKGETELVIVVTPHIAVPRRGKIALPGDHFVPPSDFELFVLGSQAGAAAHLRPEDRVLMSVDPGKGGVDGPHGHVLY